MPRRAAGVSAAKVRTAPPGRYGDGAGLYLLVRSEEARFWVFRYVRSGRMREMGLGPAAGPAPVSLAAARTRARALFEAVRAGRDPLEDRAAERAAAKAAAQAQAARGKTFGDVMTFYLAAHEAGWRNGKHRQQWENTLATYAAPHMGEVPVADVTVGHVMAALEPVWREKPETASRVRGRIELVLDFARARGWREGENPARWRGHLDNLLPARAKVRRVEHHAALPWREVGAFMVELRGQAGIGAKALEFTILTAARSGEVRGAHWSEIDFQERVWTVPAGRMKAGRLHRVPLSEAALSVLREMQPLARDDDPIFPGARVGTGLSDMSLTAVLPAHGARRAYGTRFSQHLPRLGRGGDRLPARGGRSRARPHAQRQSRGRLPARRFVREAASAHGRLG